MVDIGQINGDTADLARLHMDRSSIDGQINEAQARFDQTGIPDVAVAR